MRFAQGLVEGNVDNQVWRESCRRFSFSLWLQLHAIIVSGVNAQVRDLVRDRVYRQAFADLQGDS